MAKQPAFIASASKKDSLSTDETLKLFLKCADISNEVRPKPIAQKIVDSLYQEMKLEKGLATSLNIPQSAICAIPREQQQLNFHLNLCLPAAPEAKLWYMATATRSADLGCLHVL